LDKLRIFDEDATLLKSLNGNQEIQAELSEVGVRFEQWSADREISSDATQEQIIEAYQAEIDRLRQEEGYQTCDVVSLTSEHPEKSAFRNKFITEHTHSEDEVRFFVKGQGLFILHIGDKVYSVLCQKDDLISVPAHTPHWFDMGSMPEFTCIRLFNNTEGWVAKYTESGIDEAFPTLD